MSGHIPLRILGVSGLVMLCALEAHASLIHEWNFDNDAAGVVRDSVGSLDSQSISGVSHTTGIVGQALSFDGTGGVDFGNVLPLVGQSFTVAFWMMTTETKYENIWTKHAGGPDGYVMQINHPSGPAGAITYVPGDGVPGDRVISNALINDGEWHRVALVVDASGFDSLYIDGVFDSARPYGAFAGNTAAMMMGAVYASNDDHFTGLLDEFQLFDSPLSAQELLADATPGGVPEPLSASLLAVSGAAVAGTRLRRRSKRT